MATSKLTIEMEAKVQQAVNGIQKVSGQLEDMQSKVQAAVGKFKGLAVGVGIAVAAIKVASDAMKDLTAAYAVQAKAEAGLQAAWKATSGAVGMSVGELKKLASSYSEITTFTDDAIIQAEQMLVTTKKIGEDVMPRATMAALDLATGLGSDLTGAAQDLGKVLANPIEEIESLKEKNIFLDDATKDTIISLAEQNKLFEAQSLILDKVEESYGGVAKEVADIPVAKIDQISKAWTDIKEDLGGALLNNIQPALDTLYDSLLKIKQWTDGVMLKSNVEAAIKNGTLSSVSDDDLTSYIGEMTNILTYADQFKVDAVKNEINARAGANRWAQMNAVGSTMAPIPLNTNDDFAVMNADLFNGYSSTGWNGSSSHYNDKAKAYRFSELASNDYNGWLSASANNFPKDLFPAEITDVHDMIVEYTLAEDARLKKLVESYNKVSEAMNLWGSSAADVLAQSFSLADQLYQNDIDALQKQLNEKKALYDEYFNSVDGKYTKEQEALDNYYANGLISQEEYLEASQGLDDEEQEAKEEAQAKMDEIQAEADKLKERQFKAKKANDIAQAVINGALSISDIWAKHGANPGVAGMLTFLSSTAIAAQIATISAQKFTPMAAGGIVESPTRALIGEAGPEAIIPLNQFNIERRGLSDASKGTITVVINVENNYSEDDLAENVYRGIERAQHAGLLPSWSYV